MTLLLWTVIANQPKIVSLLSSRGADVNALSKDNITPLDYVTINKDTEMTRLLLSLGAICSPINAYSMIESNDIDSLSVLLKARPELVNTLKIEGFPLLHVASELGKLAIVELLISKGADVNALSDDNETAFICAVRNSHDDICTRLLAERAMLEYPGLIVPSNSRLSPHILGSIFSSSSSSDDDDDERNELSDDLSAAQSSYKG